MKKLLIVLLCATVMLLSACAQKPIATEPTAPTLPSFPKEKTPLEILTAAAEQTMNDGGFTATYGRISDGQEQILESDDDFITNPDFLKDFCSYSLTAIPSNTGIIRYAVTGLTRNQLYALLHGENPGGDSSIYENTVREDCSAAIEIDAEGYLTRIEYTVAVYRADDTLSGSETTYLQLIRASAS